MGANYYAPGQHDVVCDRTGFKVKSGDTVKQYDGKRVRRESADKRHPQDRVKVVADKQSVKDARPRGDYQFVSVNQITPESL